MYTLFLSVTICFKQLYDVPVVVEWLNNSMLFIQLDSCLMGYQIICHEFNLEFSIFLLFIIIIIIVIDSLYLEKTSAEIKRIRSLKVAPII